MANTDPKHKEKKSQKRKDRQARRAEKRKEKEINEKQRCFDDAVNCSCLKNGKKSIPGFMAKNADLVCRWLRDYVRLYDKSVDNGMLRLDSDSREEFDRLIQNRIDIIDFIDIIRNFQKFGIHDTDVESGLSGLDQFAEPCVATDQLSAGFSEPNFQSVTNA